MSPQQYDADVQTVLFGYTNIYRRKKKWVAELMPEMLNPFVEQKLPPGQYVYVGVQGLVSEYSGELVVEKKSGGFVTSHNADLWASTPRFHSFESAQKMLMHWLNTERLDLVFESSEFVREARAYQFKKQSEPLPPKPTSKIPTMWDQLLS